MVDAEAMDRLPWLVNEASPKPRTRQLEIAGLTATAALLLGAALSWLLLSDLRRPSPSPTSSTTIALPRAKAPAPVFATKHAAISSRPIRLPRPDGALERPVTSGPTSFKLGQQKRQPSSGAPVSINADELLESAPEVRRTPSTAAPAAAVRSTPSGEAFNAPGDHGRLVQVAAFADIHRARPVWSKLERAYPAIARLPAAVIENRDWNGQPFYQFQVGTASEQQSQALCQSARSSGFRCEVIRTP